MAIEFYAAISRKTIVYGFWFVVCGFLFVGTAHNFRLLLLIGQLSVENHKQQTINYKLFFVTSSFTVLQMPNGLLLFNSSGNKLSGQF